HGPVASHGDAADPARLACGERAVFLIDGGDELLNEEVLIPLVAIEGIHVKALAAVGHDDDELADSSVVRKLFPGPLAAMVAPALFVFKEAVEEIEHRIEVGT